jgi:PAS domain S-box-containing protein
VFQTDPRGRLAYVNTRWRCLASLLHVEQPHGVWWQMVHPEDRARVVSQWHEALRQGHDFLAEFRVQTTAEIERWAQTRIAQVLGSDGTLRCWIGIAEDITAQRQAEAAQHRARQELEQHVLARTAQLQASNRDLTEFASVVAHDLKAPLRSVSRLAEWLAEDYRDRLGPEGARLCQLLHQRVCHLHELIDGILAYTRIGRSAERDAEVDLNALLAQIVQALAPRPEIEVVIPPNLPTVGGVPEHLRQVFQNLLDNAFKYMDKRAGRVEVAAQRSGDAWEFSVADNGPGIPPRYHEKIFQIFQRLQTDPTTPGTGIGLSLVKRIVENRTGRVWVVSAVGEGTTFRFTWPDRKAKPPHVGAAFASDSRSGGQSRR